MAQLPSNVVAVLALRAFTFIFLVVALGVLVSATLEVSNVFEYNLEYNFDDVYAYRYVLATIVIGMFFALLQIVFTIYSFNTGNKFYGVSIFQFNFYADKLISYFLGTGSAAGFGVTNELKHLLSIGEDFYELATTSIDKDIVFDPFDEFLGHVMAAIACLFLAFVTSALISILSSWALVSNEPNALPKPEPVPELETDPEAQKNLKALPEPDPEAQQQTTLARAE